MVIPRTTPTSMAAITPQNEPRPPIDHHEGGGEDLGAHRRVHAGDRREQHAGKPGQADAERRNRGHVGRERNAERADDVGILHARAHDPAECGAVDDEPGRRHRDRGDEQDEEPIARVDEVAADLPRSSGGIENGSGVAPNTMRRPCSITMARPNVSNRLRIGSER